MIPVAEAVLKDRDATVSQRRRLDGTLTVTLNNDFVPNSGDSFTLMTFASVTGTFATIDGDGSLFTPSFDAEDVTLVSN